jgi:DNA-binding CsgD family transcriptional regulator
LAPSPRLVLGLLLVPAMIAARLPTDLSQLIQASRRLARDAAEATGAREAWLLQLAASDRGVHAVAQPAFGAEPPPIPTAELVRPSPRERAGFVAQLTGSELNLSAAVVRGRQVLGWLLIAGSSGSSSSARRRLGPLRQAASRLLAEPGWWCGATGALVVADGRVLFAERTLGAWLERCPIARWWPALSAGSALVIDGAALSWTPLSSPRSGEGSSGALVQVRALEPALLSADADLSPAQRRVAESAAAGATVEEIARELGLGGETARSHLREAYRRLGVANRVELAETLAVRHRPACDPPGAALPSVRWPSRAEAERCSW